MKILKKHHYTFFAITLIMAAVCGIMIPLVNVNSDMTKYLPDDSPMKRGIEIIGEEFGAAQMTGADVKAMFHGLSDGQADSVASKLAEKSNLDVVKFRKDATVKYTLFELFVPKSVDQKSFGQEIKKEFGRKVVVETSQDGNTPPISVLVIATFLVVLILILMAQSWIEPLIFLIATGVAVALNIGTNALLPSVSITTNYIVAILQMVLSLDYSIVLINRYRQEQSADRSELESVNIAVRKAFPSIISSALTTIVGLLMLCFMRLKIGLDLGIVLAKGVVWSLVCAFTVLPSLLMIFNKGLMTTKKKTFILPTDGIARYATKFKVPMSVFAVVLFVAAMLYSNRTEISFAMARESKIMKVFPQMNPMVLVYDTNEEMAVIPLADSLEKTDGVLSVVSYPSLFKRSFTADKMVAQIQSISKDFSDYIQMPTDDMDKLTPELMRLVYQLRSGNSSDLALTFPEVAQFIISNCKDNPLFAKYIDDDMATQLDLLQSMTGNEEEDEEAVEETVVEVEKTVQNTDTLSVKSVKSVNSEKEEEKKGPTPQIVNPATQTVKKETTTLKASEIGTTDGSDISVIKFMPKLESAMPSFESQVLATLSDTAAIRRQMTIDEMTEFIGSTPYQTKMVYSFSKSKKKTLSPLEYVHFLADDLFKRKALAAFVNAEQKKGLIMRMKYMDYANADTRLSATELTSFLNEFGINGITEETVKAIAFPKKAVAEAVTATLADTLKGKELENQHNTDSTLTAAQRNIISVADSSAAIAPQKPVVISKPKKSIDDIRAELFADMMYSGKRYTPEQLAGNFKKLGYDVDKEMLSLLYEYYASVNHYDETQTMTVEQLIDYGLDTLVTDSRLAGFIDEQTRDKISGARDMIEEGLAMMRNDNHSLLVAITDLPIESTETYAFIENFETLTGDFLSGEKSVVGESIMYNEMKNGFSRELSIVTILTVLAIFLIVAITFRSLVVPIILVMTVMTAVYVNVVFSGIISGTMLYLAYLIAQSILMGATIDYGILFTNYYKEYRLSKPIDESIRSAYRGSIRTIMTSGLIMVAAPGVMALMVDDMAISAIVSSIAIGAFAAILLIMLVLPGVLVAFDRFVVRTKK